MSEEKQFIAPASVQQWIAKAVEVRDAIRTIEARQAEELKEPKEVLEILKGRLQKFFTDSGLDKTKATLSTAAGTAYLSTTYKASLADPKAFKAFVIEKARWDLLDWKANVTATRAYVKAEKELPAGVNLTGVTKVNIRRPGQKADEEE